MKALQCVVFLVVLSKAWGQNFRVGTGLADMTGVVSENVMFGYANPNQDCRGIHLRQYSRAFVFENGGKRAAFVVADISVFSQALHTSIMEELYTIYGDLFTAENVMLSPQHTHSAPGGYHAYLFYELATGGFVNETTDAYVRGVVRSIQKAYDDLQDGDVYVNSGDLLDANANRSPYSYDQNPQQEQDRYTYNVDKEMTVLKLTGSGASDLGMVSFFPVHTTSMKNFNHLVSSDNKGYAAQLFEREMNPGVLPNQVDFVAGFAQTAEGDASPNIDGSRCNGTDDLCAYNTSTCPERPGDTTLCTGRGPAGEQFEDTRIIGERQFIKAKDLYDSADELLSGVVDYRFMWVNMSEVVADMGQYEGPCVPSMGYSFAAGATDGPGMYPFHQGILEGDPVVDDLIDSLFGRPEWLQICQAPKPVLIPTGTITGDKPWQPEIVPLQIFRFGEFFIAGVPGEITTMAARRVADAVKNALVANGLPTTIRVVVAAVTNEYSSYIVTLEEYSVQRYEGASTIYGPYTLDGYISKYSEMADAMGKGEPVELGEGPPDLRGQTEPALDPLLIDETEPGQVYGDILIDALDSYQAGETAFVTFVAGNPRNNLMTESTFLDVQRQEPDTSWVVEYTDAHWETKFIWSSNCHEDVDICFLPNITGCTPQNVTDMGCFGDQISNSTIEWDIPATQVPGTYRLVHYGYANQPDGQVVAYSGTSRSFQVHVAKGLVTRHHSKAYYVATGEGVSEREDGTVNLFQFMHMYFGKYRLNSW